MSPVQRRAQWRSRRPRWEALVHAVLLALVLMLSFALRPPPEQRVYRLHGRTVEARSEDGMLLWRRRLPQPQPGYALARFQKEHLPGALLLEGEVLYVAAANLYALRAHDGFVLWEHAIPSVTAFFTAYQVADALWWWQGTLYAETMHNHLLAFSPHNGALRWEQAVADSSISAPVFAAHTVYIVALLPLAVTKALYTVEAIDAQDGVVRWAYTLIGANMGEQKPPTPTLNTKAGTLLVHLGDVLVVLQSREGKQLGICQQSAVRHRSW
jgi:outer membrane protein assembly factor BamB